MLTVTRKQQLLDDFRRAGLRGLTADEMHKSVGGFWRLRLSELRADGCVFVERTSRYTNGKVFRWILVLEPPPAAEGDGGDEQLLDVPAPPPDNAIFGEPS